MSVHGVAAGPLFPDQGTRSARLKRRVRSIGLETLLFVLITVASPLLLAAALGLALFAIWCVVLARYGDVKDSD